jgi:hypothetical protein
MFYLALPAKSIMTELSEKRAEKRLDFLTESATLLVEEGRGGEHGFIWNTRSEGLCSKHS